MLGCLVGTDAYIHNKLTRVCDKIAERAEQYEEVDDGLIHLYKEVDDGLIHLQLHKFSTNAMLQYFLRTTRPALTEAHAQLVDEVIWKALLDFSEVPLDEREDASLQEIFKDAGTTNSKGRTWNHPKRVCGHARLLLSSV